jgi:hypothetical protein
VKIDINRVILIDTAHSSLSLLKVASRLPPKDEHFSCFQRSCLIGLSKMDDLMQSVFCPNSPIAQKSFNEALHCFQRFAEFALHSPVVYFQIFNISPSYFALSP